MTIEELVALHPQVFHMAESGTWRRIRQDGLLSTSALLDLYGIRGQERLAIESMRRPNVVPITSRRTGQVARVRDNKPLSERWLEECLTDMTPRQWYETLNRRVFWVETTRLKKLVGARAYRDRPHDVITVDTRRLVERDADRIALAAINTGAAFAPNAARRGRDTFLLIADYPFDPRRPRARPIVELTVDFRVDRLEEVALRVERWQRDEPPIRLWTRPDQSP